jgi:hypothetical protein
MSIPRLHTSSVLVGIFAAYLLVMMIGPGRGVTLPWMGATGWLTLEHGWPWKYLRRQVEVDLNQFESMAVGSGRGGGPWLTARHWDFSEAIDDSRWRFRPLVLICDLVVAAGVIAASVAAWEFWRRRRGGRVRFRIIDMLIIATAICAVFGWLKYLEAAALREQQLTRTSHQGWGASGDACIAPMWLRALVGDRVLPDYFWRATSAEIDPVGADDPQQTANDLAKLSCLGKIVVRWSSQEHYPYSTLKTVPQARELEIRNTEPIEESDVKELTQLSQLHKITYTIDFSDPDRLNIVGRLKSALPNCEVVDSYDDW